MRRRFAYPLVAGLVLAAMLAAPSTGPAVALDTKLTTDDKVAIYTRCKKAGGTGKACCAAADGTWEPDSQGGGTCALGRSSIQEGARSRIAPNKILVSP